MKKRRKKSFFPLHCWCLGELFFRLFTVKINTFCLVPINHSLPRPSSACSCHRTPNVACLMNKLKRCSISAIKTDNSPRHCFSARSRWLRRDGRGHEAKRAGSMTMNWNMSQWSRRGKRRMEGKKVNWTRFCPLYLAAPIDIMPRRRGGGEVIAIRNNGVSLMQFARAFCAHRQQKAAKRGTIYCASRAWYVIKLFSYLTCLHPLMHEMFIPHVASLRIHPC